MSEAGDTSGIAGPERGSLWQYDFTSIPEQTAERYCVAEVAKADEPNAPCRQAGVVGRVSACGAHSAWPHLAVKHGHNAARRAVARKDRIVAAEIAGGKRKCH